MKIGIILKPNTKGQLVIPKELREKLGIKPNSPLHVVLRGNGLYIYPISGVVGQTKNENSYLKVLERTKGVWGSFEGQATRVKQRQLELQASARRRKAW